jgi:hypothetical protein
LRELPSLTQLSSLSIATFRTSTFALYANAPKIFLFILAFALGINTVTRACLSTVTITQTPYDILQQNSLDSQTTEQKESLSTGRLSQESFLEIPLSEQKNPPKKLNTYQQSYTHAIIMSTALGSLNALGCCILERHLPLWWPLNVVAARISCSLLLPSLVYAYLAFAEERGLSCHCSTMHTNAVVTDWITYLAIKKFH